MAVRVKAKKLDDLLRLKLKKVADLGIYLLWLRLRSWLICVYGCMWLNWGYIG